MREQLETLVLDGYGLAVGERVLATSLSLTLLAPSLTTLVGRPGAGKSMVLRALAGQGPAGVVTWGHAFLNGRPVGPRNRPGLVEVASDAGGSLRDTLALGLPGRTTPPVLEQRQRLTEALECRGMEHLIDELEQPWTALPAGAQRLAAIVRHALAEPLVLMVDDALHGLDAVEADAVVALLRFEARRRAVLVTASTPRHAVALGGHLVMLSGGGMSSLPGPVSPEAEGASA